MTQLSFRLSDFEGPLDLLLHLIAKHKLNILDIEISELLRQYLEFIDNREDKDLEVTSEFLEMAARLVHIKTVSLLPKHEKEASQLKNTLTGELMEYRLCKLLAAKLGELADKTSVYVRRPMKIETDYTYRLSHDPAVLTEALQNSAIKEVRKRPEMPLAFSSAVTKNVVSVNSRIIYLMRKLYRQPECQFSELFSEQKNRSELVATFLALLELIKGGRVTVSDDGQTVSFDKTKNRSDKR